jgi:hypothetical protein
LLFTFTSTELFPFDWLKKSFICTISELYIFFSFSRKTNIRRQKGSTKANDTLLHIQYFHWANSTLWQKTCHVCISCLNRCTQNSWKWFVVWITFFHHYTQPKAFKMNEWPGRTQKADHLPLPHMGSPPTDCGPSIRGERWWRF